MLHYPGRASFVRGYEFCRKGGHDRVFADLLLAEYDLYPIFTNPFSFENLAFSMNFGSLIEGANS
jgi:hypothetical protein